MQALADRERAAFVYLDEIQQRALITSALGYDPSVGAIAPGAVAFRPRTRPLAVHQSGPYPQLPLPELEARAIRRVLAQPTSRAAAARALGISHVTLAVKCARYGIPLPVFVRPPRKPRRQETYGTEAPSSDRCGAPMPNGRYCSQLGPQGCKHHHGWRGQAHARVA